jgi:hypothetical protein
MRDNLVVNPLRFQENAENFAAGAGDGCETYVNVFFSRVGDNLILDGSKAFFQGLDWIAERPSIMARGDFSGFRVD